MYFIREKISVHGFGFLLLQTTVAGTLQPLPSGVPCNHATLDSYQDLQSGYEIACFLTAFAGVGQPRVLKISLHSTIKTIK